MEVKGYLANQFGFSEVGKFVLDNLIKPKLRGIEITVLDPFEECGKELDFNYLNGLEKHADIFSYWRNFNKKVTSINNALMEKSDCLLALLDGGHAIDDGVSSEIGNYGGMNVGRFRMGFPRRPIFALRSDFRLCENISGTINAQVAGYISQSGGKLITRLDENHKNDAVERWIAEIKKWREIFVASCEHSGMDK